MNRILARVYIFLFLVISGCEKEEEPWTRPPAPESQYAETGLGENYDSIVFIDLKTGEQTQQPATAFDLFFSTTDTPAVWLNGAQFMMAAATGTSDFSLLPEISSLQFTPDMPDFSVDSAALAGFEERNVFVVDRGRIYHDGPERYFKFQLIEITQEVWRFRSGLLDDPNGTIYELSSGGTQSLAYWKYATGQVYPAPARWDLLFGRYVHVYINTPEDDPFRNYAVTGALLNRWDGRQGAVIMNPDAVTYDSLKATSQLNPQWKSDADVIGFDWKYYDFDRGFVMRNDRYFLLRRQEGTTWKIKFTGFLNDEGRKGFPSFLYQLIQ